MADLQGLGGKLGGTPRVRPDDPIQEHMDVPVWYEDVDQWWTRRPVLEDEGREASEKITSMADVCRRYEERLAKAG